ncbi:metallophosphoesterase [Paenibacillus sp. CMAA1364]
MTAFISISSCILVMGLLLLYRMYKEAFSNQINIIDIELKRLPQALHESVILFITDIHRRELPEDVLLDLKGQVDWVLLGGDMMEKDVPLSRVENNIRILSQIAPVYAVHGNHDYKADVRGLDSILKKLGVILLLNSNVKLEKGGSYIWLTGLDYPQNLKRTYPALPKLARNEVNQCRIVLVHDPAWYNRYAIQPVDLTLAGHTHGGQIVVPFIGSIHLDKGYRGFSSGLYQRDQPHSQVKNAQVFISRGFGYRHVPLRLRCPAEMNLMKLRCN